MTPDQVKELVERLLDLARTHVATFDGVRVPNEAREELRKAASALALLAQEREELREALNTAEAVIADIAGASWGYVAPNYESGPPMTHRDLTIGRAEKYIAARAALKER